MTDLAPLLAGGNAWLFVPSAILLGALHGLEPGHSKTMMAAFIVAVRGTVAQAVLLGLSATLSHTAIVWLVALAGLHFGRSGSFEADEPWFQLASAALMAGVAGWMAWRTWRGLQGQGHAHRHDHDHDAGHGHGHGHDHDPPHLPADLALALDHAPGDAHARAHADDIRRRFAGRPATTGQIVLFGLTGGLVPCPASITVLLLCLQVHRLTLGLALVACFSLGLALTLVAAGAAAALAVKHASGRWSGFGRFAARAPFASSALILAVAVALAAQALRQLGAA